MKTLSDTAQVIRSKNAGPFTVTFDILFPTTEMFEQVQAEGLLSRAAVAGAYGVSENELIGFDFHPFARAVKFSLRRPVGSGGPGDSDCYGAQQHAPLLDLPVLSEDAA